MTLASLQRLIAFKPEELVLHALYRTQDGPNPGTKARCKEVTELAICGLTQALVRDQETSWAIEREVL